MRAWARLAIAALTVAVATGCATSSRDSSAVMLRAVDGPLWLYPDQIGRYRCERGPLVCTDAIGRRSKRLCRCTE